MATLSGKVALVTGGGRGIGRGIALALAKYGAKVAVMARSTDEIEQVANKIRERGGTALALTGDVANYTDVQRIVAKTETELGAIDILVNNAAIIYVGGYLEETNPETWLQTQQVNLVGAYYTLHATLPHMKAQGYGRIVNISSGAARSIIPRGSAYCVSKAGLETLTKIVAAETQDTDICVVSVYPGAVDTMMQAELRNIPVEQLGEELYTNVHKLKIEGKLGDPLHIGEQIVAVLMTDKTGEILDINEDEVQNELTTILAQAEAVG
jgi:NAD(P)-dependent dehydrogenase (short-subunit alcohol dehydrogenase family)